MAVTGGVAGPTIGVVGPLPAGQNGGLPTGGTTGQPLVKASNADFDAAWQTLGVAGGGTGQVTFTQHALLIGNGTGALTQAAAGTSGQLLLGNTGADPSWSSAGVNGQILNVSGGVVGWTSTPVLGIVGATLGTLGLAGNTSGTATLTPQAVAGTPTLTLPNTSGTLAASAAAPVTLNATTGQIGLTTAALTASNDTNVTLTLGGSPSTALVAATSLTLGWSGTLAPTRGGTGLGSYTLGDTVYSSAANTLAILAGNITTTKQYLSQTGTGTVSAAPAWSAIAGGDVTGAALTAANDTNVTLTLGGTPATSLLRSASITAGWTGTLAAARLNANVVQAVTNDTNVTGSIATQTLTLGWLGTLAVGRGGTGLGSGTSGGVLGFTATGTIASSAALTANGVVLGGGAGATPTSTSAGTTGQVLMGVTSAPPSFQTLTAALNFIIDGGGATITTGTKGYLLVPFACTVTSWTALADQSGSITIDVYNDSYANYGTNTSMVGAGTKPNIATATKGQSAPSGWTSTTIAAGSIVGFNVASITTCQRVTIELTVNRTSA